MTAALSLLVGTSAAFAGGDTIIKNPYYDYSKTKVKVEKKVTFDRDKYDLDIDQGKKASVKINDNTITQHAVINNKEKSVSVIDISKKAKRFGNIVNMNNVAVSLVNTGDVSNNGKIKTGAITGHSNSASASAVGLSSTVGVTISSISTTHKR